MIIETLAYAGGTTAVAGIASKFVKPKPDDNAIMAYYSRELSANDLLMFAGVAAVTVWLATWLLKMPIVGALASLVIAPYILGNMAITLPKPGPQ